MAGQIAITAATKAAAKRAALAIAARTVVKRVVGRITSSKAKRCYKGFAVGSGASVLVTVQQMGDGKWKARVGNGAFAAVSNGIAGCLSTNIR